MGLDLNMVVAELLRHDIIVRGLAHPVIFGDSGLDELGGRVPGLVRKTTDGGGVPFTANTANFRLFGAVMVTPKNYYRLMQTGQNALLFPGGVKEVFHGKGEAYKIFWPDKVDFVRTAARFNATIITLSSVGMADSLNILADNREIANLPFLGQRAKEFAKNVTAARFDKTPEDEFFLPPLVAPKLPSRNYFLFGKPVSTTHIDPNDRKSCQDVYNQLQREIENGFDDILRAREKDPYRDYPLRVAYERWTQKQAPTFDIQELNRF